MEVRRQGDVLIIKTDEDLAPSKRVPRQGGRVILAAGELTGHHHAIASRDAALFDIDGETDRLLRVRRPVNLDHEEHSTVRLPPGDYRIRIQREYSAQEIRNVQD